jgi:hypothetical protein
MKKRIQILSSFVVFVAFFMAVSPNLSAQCVIDSGVPNMPGIYPPVPPNANGCEYYETDITFVLPQDTTVTIAGNTLTLPFTFFRIDSVVGLPPGLTWECNLTPECEYIVNEDSAMIDTLGCIRISGTPQTPGFYPLTVHLTANVEIFGSTQDQPSTFISSLTVGPCPFVGDCYTINQSSSCNPTAIDFTNNIPSNGHPGFSYQWNINGPGGYSFSSHDENPPSQFLPEGGDYFVDYQATIDTAGFFLNGVTIDSVVCTDLLDAADLYWILIDPSGIEIVNTSSNPLSNIGNSLPLATGISNIKLDTGIYEFQVWDRDNIIPDAGCTNNATGSGASMFFSVPTSNTGFVTLTELGLKVTFLFDNPISVVNCSDTIHVDSTPPPPTIFSESQFVCAGDSLELSIVSDDSIQWYLDGNPITDANSSSYQATEGGTYTVEVIDLDNFCSNTSVDFVIQSVEVTSPDITFDGDFTLFVTMPDSQYSYQWYDNDDNLVGSGDSLKPDQSGSYYAVAVDTVSGCTSAPSEVVKALLSSLDQLASSVAEINLYPNPASDHITVSFNLVKPQPVKLTMHDLFGKTIKIQTLSPSAGSFQQRIKLGRIPSGIYVVSLEFEDGTFREKVVVRNQN